MNWVPAVCFLLGVALIAFLIGSVPFGFLIGKARGVDIRRHGSGNIGATNVFRTLGKGWGILVFLLDASKGLLAVRLGMAGVAFDPEFWARAGVGAELAGVVAAVAVILGHNYTPWLGFRGGKGIATSLGVLGGLMPPVAGIAAGVWFALWFATRYVSLASIGAALCLPVVTGIWLKLGWLGWTFFWFALAAGAMAVWKHRPNITRLLNGTEPRTAPRNKGAA